MTTTTGSVHYSWCDAQGTQTKPKFKMAICECELADQEFFSHEILSLKASGWVISTVE